MKTQRFVLSILPMFVAPLAFAENAGPGSVPGPRVLQADVQREAGPLSRAYRVCVGAGRAHEGLRGEWQRQLKLCRDELGFEYLRFHGLFHDDMGVCARKSAGGQLMFNWQYVDMLYDYMLSIGVKPFVELSFMPEALASGKKTVFWWQGNITPPKKLEEWGELVHQFALHITERYGAEEVKSWYFEVWNEPNLDIFWSGNQEDYFALYRASVQAIKTVNPAYRVGGPATAGCGWIDEMISYCAKERLPLDFLSTHTYNVRGAVDEFGTKQLSLLSDLRSVSKDVLRTRDIIQKSAMPGRELHMTEWSASYSPRDPVHDDYFSAPYILEQLKRVGASAQSMSYWVFTDIFEESGIPMRPFHGGFGLLNQQGIKKPAFFAYRYLNRLGDRELVTLDPSAWVTRDASGGVQALFWDLTHPFPDGKTYNQQGFVRVRPAPAKDPVSVQLGGLKPGAYLMELHRTGYQNNDAYTQYLAWGAPANLTRQQEEQLRALTLDAAVESETLAVGADGQFKRQVAMRENDVVLLTLTPASAALPPVR